VVFKKQPHDISSMSQRAGLLKEWNNGQWNCAENEFLFVGCGLKVSERLSHAHDKTAGVPVGAISIGMLPAHTSCAGLHQVAVAEIRQRQRVAMGYFAEELGIMSHDDQLKESDCLGPDEGN
jgi:hypothetical protein